MSPSDIRLGATYRRYGNERLYIIVSVEQGIIRVVPVANPNQESEKVGIDHLEPLSKMAATTAFTMEKLDGDYAGFLRRLMKLLGCEPGQSPEPQVQTIVAAGYPSPFRFATLLRRMIGKSDDEPDAPPVVTMSHGKKQIYFCNDNGLSKAAVHFVEG